MLTPIMPAQRLLPVSIGILALGMAIALLYYGRVFFITVIIASIIAFLLDPVVELFMKMRLNRIFCCVSIENTKGIVVSDIKI